MTTATTFETAADLSADVRDAVRRLILACADTKLLLGYHYGEWTFGTPALEAAVANCSIAQSELGHVRLLHGILKANWDDDAEALVEGRRAEEFASVRYLDRDLADWPAVVAMNFVVDLAVTRVIHALRDSAFLPLRACAEKLLQEERYHIHHGQGWFRTLAGGTPQQRDGVVAAVERALADAVEWLGPDGAPDDAALVRDGIKASADAELGRALIEDVSRAAASQGITLRPVAAPAPAEWDPGRRRSDTSAPSEEVLYHLRGTKNEMFKRA